MVKSNINALGIIFPNYYDSLVPELVNERLMGSIPFASRYRLIDFVLSSMVNSGTMMRGRAAVSVRPRRDTMAIILSERFFYFSTICPMCKTAALFCLHLRILYGKIAK